MATKTIRRVDDLGRIVLPSHIRKALNLNPGNHVSVDLDEDGIIRVVPVEERCSICGESVEEKHHTKVKIGANEKCVCFHCAQTIAREIVRGK